MVALSGRWVPKDQFLKGAEGIKPIKEINYTQQPIIRIRNCCGAIFFLDTPRVVQDPPPNHPYVEGHPCLHMVACGSSFLEHDLLSRDDGPNTETFFCQKILVIFFPKIFSKWCARATHGKS